MARRKKIGSLDALRELAGRGRVLRHLGFVVPLTLHRSGYQARDGATFWLKCLLRLAPFGYATVVMVVVRAISR